MDLPSLRSQARPLAALLVAAIAAFGCAAGDASPSDSAATPSSTAGAPPPRDEMDARLDSSLARFRTGLPRPARLEGGEPSRDALVRRFVRALADADTADLRRMVMSRAEFAHLYYPGSAYTRRPTRQEVELVWFLHLQGSQKGVSRALARYGTLPLELVGYECAPDPVREGANALWHGCVLRLGVRADTTEIRLFGPVLEREGTFKLYSYENDL